MVIQATRNVEVAGVRVSPDAEPGTRERAARAASRLGLPLLEAGTAPSAADMGWVLDATDGLALLDPASRARAVRADFLTPAFRGRLRRATAGGELLARAVGLAKQPGRAVVDGTAGLGRDAVLLAALGARVTAYEREPVVALLLEDGLRRLALAPGHEAVAGRIALRCEDIRRAEPPPGVLYLDPMFPEARHRHAAKRETEALRALAAPPPDEQEWMNLVRRWPGRVVVKRPGKTPPLAGRKPHHRLAGKTVRFDVYEG